MPDGFNAVANCNSNPEYLEATITFRPKYLKVIDEETVVHELLHVVTAEATSYYEKNDKPTKMRTYFTEKMVSHLTRAYLKAYGYPVHTH